MAREKPEPLDSGDAPPILDRRARLDRDATSPPLRRRLDARRSRPQRVRDTGRGWPGLRAGARPARRHRPLGTLFPLVPAARRPRRGRCERLSAFNAGIGVAGVAVHFKAWPWSLHRGVPMLDEAEGLSEAQLPAYNSVLWAWGDLAACSASLTETRPRLAALRPRRPAQLPDPADLRPPPLPLGARAGAAATPSAGARPCWTIVTTAGPAGCARGALCLSFDNLGEAAEIELGAPGRRTAGAHPTATQALPALLEALNARRLAATFFVEGLNAELYPEALREIDARGHEVAYHAWRHEQWAGLSAARAGREPGARSGGLRRARPLRWPACGPRAAALGAGRRSRSCAGPG